jgi:hypothetical protein
MALDYLGIEKDEDWLWRRLGAGDVTPFLYLEKLTAALGVGVEVHTGGVLEDFGPYIESGLPIIVAVDADDQSTGRMYVTMRLSWSALIRHVRPASRTEGISPTSA